MDEISPRPYSALHSYLNLLPETLLLMMDYHKIEDIFVSKLMKQLDIRNATQSDIRRMCNALVRAGKLQRLLKGTYTRIPEEPLPLTAAQDTVLRLVLGMMIADRASSLDDVRRDWIAGRLMLADSHGHHMPLTDEERARLRPLIMGYVLEHRPSIKAVVFRQFKQGVELA